MHEKIKGSIIHIIDHAGHLSNMENSGEFNNHLSGFLSSIKHLILP
jgi:pimeloyl-ACP methyl ester carboxylesterase